MDRTARIWVMTIVGSMVAALAGVVAVAVDGPGSGPRPLPVLDGSRREAAGDSTTLASPLVAPGGGGGGQGGAVSIEPHEPAVAAGK